MKNLKREQNKRRKSNFLYDFVKITGAIPTLCLFRPKIIKLGEKSNLKIKSGLVCANHSSFLDPVIIQCVFWERRLQFLATEDLFCNKLKCFFFSQMNCIPVNKNNFNIDSIHEVCGLLKEKKIVVVFPEGTVDHNKEELIEFKSGALLMAHIADVDIIPIYIVPIKKWYKRRVILIGDPIRIRELCRTPSIKSLDETVIILRDKILDLKNKYKELQEEKI